jgi:hypothetical protein
MFAYSSSTPPSHGEPSMRSGLSIPTTAISEPVTSRIVSSVSLGVPATRARHLLEVVPVDALGLIACRRAGEESRGVVVRDAFERPSARRTSFRLARSVFPIDDRPAQR